LSKYFDLIDSLAGSPIISSLNSLIEEFKKHPEELIAPAIIVGGLLVFFISSFIKDRVGARFRLAEMRDKLAQQQKAFATKAKLEEDEHKRMLRDRKRKEWRT
jgi:hypothetical protein